MERESGVDISALPMDAAMQRIAEAEALRDMRIEEQAMSTARGIALALGAN